MTKPANEVSLHPTIARKLMRELNQPASLPPTKPLGAQPFMAEEL